MNREPTLFDIPDARRIAAASAWIDADRQRRVDAMHHRGFYAHREAGFLGWMRRRGDPLGRQGRRGA